jgi:aminopeptidase N
VSDLIRQLVSPVGADDYLPGHGDPTYDARHYDLEIDYKLESNHLSGRARVDLVAREELTQFTLDLHGLRAAKVSIPKVGVAKYATRRGKLIVTTKSVIAAGNGFTVLITYGGNPRPVNDAAGQAGWEELDDGVLVAGQPGGAPSWFPCNDRPSNKATYHFSVTVASDYHVVANGILRRTTRRASSTTWVYDQVEPMATYLATVQIGRYASRVAAVDPVTIRTVLPPALVTRSDTALARQPEMMELFLRLFGPYPFAEYTVVVTDDELEIPLEAQGLSMFGRNFLTSDWTAVRLVAHELSHQWFGNSLTVEHWRDIWLHEGFACYAEWLWSEESGSRRTHERAVEHWGRLAELPQDVVIGDPGPDLMFDDRVYKRGALTLHALRLTVGDEPFFAMLRAWVRDNAYGNVTTEQFTAFAAEDTGHDLDALFNDWLFREELPALPLGR